MKINIRKSAIRDLKNIDPESRKLITSKLSGLENFPDVPNIKKLTNFEPAYRLRVGQYRILFDALGDTIYIGRILHRRDSYK